MSLGYGEIILILLIVLLVFGGKRIPELARSLGRAAHEFKKAKNEIEKEEHEIVDAVESTVETTQGGEQVPAQPAAEKDSAPRS